MKMSTGRILVVEDEATLLEMLKYNLEQEGYTVETASDGNSGLDIARSKPFDVLILDIMLPNLDGFSICRILRQETTMPILMLTAKEEEVDKVLGLELGADDYMTKPFSVRELKARVKAMLRRAEMKQATDINSEDEPVNIGELTIDPVRRVVLLGDIKINLKPQEFDLLLFLAKNKSRVFTRETLLDRVWGYDYVGGTRTVDVHIRWLREKIEAEPSKPQYLITVRGIGYKLDG